MTRWLGLMVLSLLLAWTSGAARAQQTPPMASFALIVTNNHSPQLGRAELQYADDDGAKYYDVFRTITTEDRVELLTDFDRDSARLFPQARAKASSPTRANVDAAVRRIGAAVQDATRGGGAAEFYFVFAGHGDVDQGRGFLELRDGRLDSQDIEAMLKSIPATHAHVILDSCNSFFVLNPRKPGGHQVAVTEQAAQSLGERLPNVGVLLSTSAEAEVFEWSELQSGIFSHAVRSGLSGAADADHDGRVTYEELRAFVEVASSQVRNPLYRPKLFARGPGGHDTDCIFDLRASQARLVQLEAGKEQRVTLRDADDLPWVDAHKEAGVAMTLRLPSRLFAEGATVDERDPSTGAILARYALHESADQAPAPIDVHGESVGAQSARRPIALASLDKVDVVREARGPNEVLADLFGAPFGPKALASWRERARLEAPPVFGVSREDADRMRLLLGQVSDIEHRGRIGGGVELLALGSLLVGGGSALLATNFAAVHNGAEPDVAGVVGDVAAIVGGGLLLIPAGIYALTVPSDGEKIYRDYVAQMRAPNTDRSQVVASTERRLQKLASQYRDLRTGEVVSGGLLVLSGALLIASAPYLDAPDLTRFSIGTMGVVSVFMAASFILHGLQPSPIERMWDLWTHDPGLVRMPRRSAFTIWPTGNGIAGTF